MNGKLKSGISLIVLVITIIVMIILATAVVLTLSNSGIIGRANEAVNSTNVAQMQNLATMLWSDAYLEGKTGKELAREVKKGLLKVDPIYEAKYNVEITDGGVTVTDDGEWDTLYDGGATTSDGYVVLDNKPLFNGFDLYRFTIENENGDTYIAKTRLLYYAEAKAYLCCGIVAEEVVYFDSIDEVLSTDFEGVAVGAMQVTENGETLCGMIFEGGDSNWTVKKVEKQKVVGTLVYKGDGTAFSSGPAFEVPGLSVNRDYIMVCEFGGEEHTLSVGGAVYWGGPGLVLTDNGQYYGIHIQNNAILNLYDGLVIKEIYDIGESRYAKSEGAFVVTLDGTLIGTPTDEQYTIPKTVAGIEVKRVQIDGLLGIPVIDRHMEFVDQSEPCNAEKIIVKKEAESVIPLIGETQISIRVLDVTDCGDNVVLTENCLYTIGTIYVTMNAKLELYSDASIPDHVKVVGVE